MGDQEIYLIEAVGNGGVKIKTWSVKRKNLGKLYQRIVLRRLKFDRTPQVLENLQKFLQEIEGHQY